MTLGSARQDVLLDRIAEEVGAVEQVLRETVASEVTLVTDVACHTLAAGGKRLRPALVGLCAAASGGADRERARRIGACMEMIHMATLIHDDVIDHAQTRRGRPTASSVFGNTASILTGDVLLSKAMSILAEDGDIELIRIVSQSVVLMAEGEVLELDMRGRFDLSRADHERVLGMKTASFISACCHAGAILGGADAAKKQALTDYGWHIGMAFQIADDLLDYQGDQAKTGKPRAIDFREGCATLPLILLRDSLPTAELAEVRTRFGNGVTDEQIGALCSLMARVGVFDSAADAATKHIADAVKALEPIPNSQEREILESVAEFIVKRES